DASLYRANLTGTRIHYATFQGTFMDECTNCPINW
ncbi:MAG: pentapeptide repeat-containing protein, partial [Pseudomonadota bacterium]|nr:pentapeptide repeat-containing protein [Pseudomonadota bacterium]